MFTVAALYRFTRFTAPDALRAPLHDTCTTHGVKGILLLAPEGINGTVAGTRAGIDAVLAHIRTLPGCDTLEWKESTAAAMPFLRMKVRLKREIVTMGQPDIDPVNAAGTHVDPTDWNALIDAPDVAVIDTRNGYETAIGTFAGAIAPDTESFADFPAWWQANRDALQGKRIAMFCTGGIRCEKSTAFLRAQGVNEVFHLKGGILKYLESIPEPESRWQGECFVFDQRVAVKHGLEQGDHTLCHGCRHPVSAADRAHETYEPGVACPHCAATITDADRARYRERQRQIMLARARGQTHLGG